MLWIKRNLFLAITGFIALVFLLAGTYYLYSGVQKNKQLENDLEEQKQALLRLYAMSPFPARTNIDELKRELDRFKETTTRAKEYFAPVPFEKVTGLEFKTVLDNTIADLRKTAAQKSVKLPEAYSFSFKEEQKALTLPDTMFPALPAQLAEVGALCNVLFDAKINALENVRRPKIAGSEAGTTEHHAALAETNSATGFVSTPYEFTFLTFSPELSDIVKTLSTSKNGFVLKTVSLNAIQPEKKKTNQIRRPLPAGGAGAPAGAPATAAPAAAVVQPRSRPGTKPVETMETVINEKLLKVTLWIYAVRPAT